MVSHDHDLLRKYCQKALWIEGGRMRKMGGLEEVIAEYEQSFEEALGWK